MIACYDPEGNEHLREFVDARECVLHCGYTFERPAIVAEAIEEEEEEEEEKPSQPKRGRPKAR